MTARAELVAYLEEGVRARRNRGPNTDADDVMGDIAVAIDAGLMSEQEIQGLTLLLIAAGMETTSGLMGNIAYALATGEVGAADLIDASTGEVGINAMEEFLRHDSPAQWLARVTTKPVEIHGTLLPEGSRVLVLFASANRDPRAFDRPDERLLDRQETRHMSFGEGVHFCLGRPLARLETRIGMTTLLRRIPSFTAAGPPVRYPSHVIRGFESVPVTLG
jgi:unspecific monooxygenase